MYVDDVAVFSLSRSRKMSKLWLIYWIFLDMCEV
jgi:hypothetical protein